MTPHKKRAEEHPQPICEKYWPNRIRMVRVVIAFALSNLPFISFANPSDLCLTSARAVAHETGIPLSVLLAITLTETGRQVGNETQPWPWAINREGSGNWFDDHQTALDFAKASVAADRTSFDVGCFQINYRWHGENFTSLEAMFDPIANARYAADFLIKLYNETGDWSEAAGTYHSRTTEHANSYRVTFDRYRQKSVENGADHEISVASADLDQDEAEIPNFYPLLKTGSGSGSLGSLVPMTGGG